MDVEGLYLRGKEVADSGNYDYAITIFVDVLRSAPNHRNSRIALRGCEMQRFQEHGGGFSAKLSALLKGIGPLILMHLSGGKPEKVMEQCERYLAHDPTNLHVLKLLARACARQGYLDAASDTLEFARQRNPSNVTVLRRLGEVLYQLGQYDKSIRCYKEINTLKPQDHEASDRMREISAESHLKRSRLEDAQSFKEGLRDQEKSKALAREGVLTHSDEERESEIDKLQKATEENAGDAEAWMRLGEAYSRSERYVDAEGAFRKAFEINKKYLAREKIGTARIRQLEQVERKAQKDAEDRGQEPQKHTAYIEARRRRLDFCIKEFEFRRKQHPTDLRLAWQLGLYYMELAGEENIQRAIPNLQAAMGSPGFKVRAQHMLGKCFALNPKTFDMAREQFVKALESMEDMNTDMGKALMYEIAGIAEKQGNAAEALTWYKKVFAIDASYQDVSKKIQELG